MAFGPWGIVVLLIGLAYGWASPGRQDKGRLFRNGLMIGLVLAVVLVLVGALAGSNPLGVVALSGALGTVLLVVILTLLFIVGAWLGDLIEGGMSRRRTV